MIARTNVFVLIKIYLKVSTVTFTYQINIYLQIYKLLLS